ncbi:MAG TPA: hypothetical protein VF627_06145 [Abditibacterium sp.]|jgi:Spy/CpxP family protein refolding chaperone
MILTNIRLLALGGALMSLSFPAVAQSSIPTQNSTSTAASNAAEVSLIALLQMPMAQIERLNRLYADFASRRAGQENYQARLQTQLTAAQSPTSFDEKKAASLLRELGENRQKSASEFVSTRAKALQILQPVQRAQLQSIATDSRYQFKRDAYFLLLLLPVEQSEATQFFARQPLSQPNFAQRNNARFPGSGNYGVYGGYGLGGPNYGVYGGYGVGGVGVYGGLGRGGPSIGIGIGGLFGGRGFGGRGFGGRGRRW